MSAPYFISFPILNILCGKRETWHHLFNRQWSRATDQHERYSISWVQRVSARLFF